MQTRYRETGFMADVLPVRFFPLEPYFSHDLRTRFPVRGHGRKSDPRHGSRPRFGTGRSNHPVRPVLVG